MACGPDPMVGEVDAVQAWPESISHVQEAANRLEGKMESSDESAGNVVFNITISAPRPHRPPIEAALATLENSIPVAALKNDWYSFSFLLSVAFSTIGLRQSGRLVLSYFKELTYAVA